MRRLLLFGLVWLGAGCMSATIEDLRAPLEGIAEVELVDDELHIVCRDGDEMRVAARELEANLIGMGDGAAVLAVAQKINDFCEAKIEARKEVARKERAVDDALRENGLATTGEFAARRARLCRELSLLLPAGDRRAAIEKNHEAYGCDADAEAPQKAWSISYDRVRRYAVARLLSTTGRETLVIRCNRGTLRAFLLAKERLRQGDVLARAAGSTRVWVGRPSKDKKTLFFVDSRGCVDDVGEAAQLRLTYKNQKKRTRRRTFAVAGFPVVREVLGRYCKL